MKIYNTATRQKQELQPIIPGKVKIYSCGPTVYNYFHVGNARPFVVFDVLRRYLEYRGYEVIFIQNFTDIDDKMIARAKDENITVDQLAEHYITEYYKDADALGIARATKNPRATQCMDQIIALVQKLVELDYAYVTNNGDVYFETRKFKNYGKLSGQSLEDLEEGARIEIMEDKKNASDFALWKAKKSGEPSWQSPWGAGRPGWHVECSAMSMKYLGETFDIHTGGMDLIFPHHENEIAQSEAATGKPYVNYWMHNGYINIDNQKMSKSKGNFFTVRDIAQKYDLQALRYFLLSAHYRSPINFSQELIEQSNRALKRLHTAIEFIKTFKEKSNKADADYKEQLDKYIKRFNDAMDDDLNTADALGVIFELVRSSNARFAQEGKNGAHECWKVLQQMVEILGLLPNKEKEFDPSISVLAEQRKQAREQKDWKRSDELRDELLKNGYIIEDTKNGYKLKLK